MSNPGRNAIGAAAVVATVIVIVIVGAVGLVALDSSGGSTTVHSTINTSLSTSSTTSPIGVSPSMSGAYPTESIVRSASGLQLSESVNASTITVGQSLNISIAIQNTLGALNSVPASDQWGFQGVPASLWPTCYFGPAAEIVVLTGNYTAGSLQSVANVTFNYTCMEGVAIDHVNFQPDSDQANLTGIYDVTEANQTLGPYDLALSFTTGGAWNLSSLSQQPNPPVLTDGSVIGPAAYGPGAFTPGVYTVAVADQWGQVTVLHVTVESA